MRELTTEEMDIVVGGGNLAAAVGGTAGAIGGLC